FHHHQRGKSGIPPAVRHATEGLDEGHKFVRGRTRPCFGDATPRMAQISKESGHRDRAEGDDTLAEEREAEPQGETRRGSERPEPIRPVSVRSDATGHPVLSEGPASNHRWWKASKYLAR